MVEKYDLIVIGSGPGGYVAAIRAAQLGQKTAVIERAEIGGICLNWGCIPTKALLHSATLYRQVKSAADFGIETTGVSLDFSKMIKMSRDVAGRLSKGVDYLFRKHKITVIPGQAAMTAPAELQVKTEKSGIKTLAAKNVIVATGARPRALPGLEFDGVRIITSREAMTLKKIPKSMIIIGAGAIGVEFAYFYACLGTKVTLVEMMPQILPIEDPELVKVAAKSFAKLGIEMLTQAKVEKAKAGVDGVAVRVSSKSGIVELSADIALVAIGVQGNIENLGLEKLGIKTEKGAIQVDRESYLTGVDHVYAIGDVIGPPWLAHVASAEGIAAAEHIVHGTAARIDYDNVPGCTYCQPQVASIGYSEEKAKQLGYEIKVGRFPFRANGKSLAMGHSEGFAKIIFDAKYGELLGAHIVGAEATELLAEIGVARTLETTADEIFSTIHAHPTVSEVIKEAAEDAFGMAIHI